MDDVGRLWVGIVICLALMGVMAFFCACENAAVEFNDSKLKKLADEDKRAARLLKMVENPSRFMSANLISRSIMIIIISVLGTLYYFDPLSVMISDLWGKLADVDGWKYYAVSILSFIVIICIFTLVISIFAVNIPKRLCTSGKIGDGFILKMSGVYKCWLAVFKPLEIVNDCLSGIILRIFGVRNANKSDTVTEEEILLMVDAVNETGAIEESQAEMISNIFEFDDLEIRDIMTHRTEVMAIEENAPIKDAVELAIESGFSRIPVYKDTIDDIQGVVFAKDLLTLVFHEDAANRIVKDFTRDVMFVPETNKCGELFKEFSALKQQMAVVVDEYGGTAGVATMEDCIETIVGNIQDEYDDETEEIVQLSPYVFEMLGNADYENVMEALGKEPEENSVFETIGAMVIDLLGRIPDDNETPSVKWENIRFSVLKVEDKKIEKLRAVILQETSEKAKK